MSGVVTNIATSILTMSVGLYFGILIALFGLLVLAGTAGHWSLARAWFPAFSEHLGVLVAILGFTFRWTELTLLGSGLWPWVRVSAGRNWPPSTGRSRRLS